MTAPALPATTARRAPRPRRPPAPRPKRNAGSVPTTVCGVRVDAWIACDREQWALWTSAPPNAAPWRSPDRTGKGGIVEAESAARAEKGRSAMVLTVHWSYATAAAKEAEGPSASAPPKASPETYATRGEWEQAKARWDRLFRRYRDLEGRPGARDPGPEPRAPFENIAYRVGYEERERERQALRDERAARRRARRAAGESARAHDEDPMKDLRAWLDAYTKWILGRGPYPGPAPASAGNAGRAHARASTSPWPTRSRRELARQAFEALGLDWRSASPSAVKVALKRHAFETHPDRHRPEDRERQDEAMKALSRAFGEALAAAEAEPAQRGQAA